MEKYKIIAKGTKEGFYRGCNLVTSEDVTLKRLVIRSKEGVPSSLIKEISLIKELNHSNILRLLDVVNAKDQINMLLVYEYMDVDLKRFMRTKPQTMKNPQIIKELLRQILHAVSFYHSYNIVHGGLKPENMFVNPASNILKITDFIWPRSLLNSASGDPDEDSTYNYKAPEILVQHKHFSTALDVWSVGCIFAEMVTHRPLFPAQTDFHQLCKIFSIMGTPTEETWPGITKVFPFLHIYDKSKPKDLQELVPNLEPVGVDLLSKLVYMDPKSRITANKALEHEYFHS